MSVRLVTVDGKHRDDEVQLFTFAIYRGHIAAAVNGRSAKPGQAMIDLAGVIGGMLDDAEANTAMVSDSPGDFSKTRI